MSTRMRSSIKPPLPKSPIRTRRIPIQSNSVQTPPGSLTKSARPIRGCEYDEMEIRPEYLTISMELRALAKKVREDLGEDEKDGPNKSPMFERGRFYEEYSARRNERLKRKKVEEIGKMSCQYNLGVNVESAKRGTSKKIGSARKSMSSAISVERTSVAPRYSLRSMSKENKKPPLPLYADKSMIATRRAKKTQY